jgi:ArsR family transcriptional regulator, repressor of sdpIR and other operons
MGIAETFKVLSDPLRLNILVSLKSGRLTAGEISEKFDITPAALSYHLKLFKNADLVMEYKHKNFIYYELNTTVFNELIIWIKQFGGNEDEK